MPPIPLGLLCGAAFGTLAVLLMLPLKFANKRDALLAAFASRFAIGFLVPNLVLPLPAIATGALAGLLVSLPDAIVTRAYAPILGIGVAGGALVGFVAARLA
jgi:hypothetical protein